MVRVFVFCSILNIVLNYFLIPIYGIVGAAIATGFSIFAVNVARTIEIYILEEISIFRPKLIKPFIVGIITGGTVLFLKQLLHYQLNVQYFLFFVTMSLALYSLLTWKFVMANDEKQLIYTFLIKGKKLFQ